MKNVFLGDYEGPTKENSKGRARQRFETLPDRTVLKVLTKLILCGMMSHTTIGWHKIEIG